MLDGEESENEERPRRRRISKNNDNDDDEDKNRKKQQTAKKSTLVKITNKKSAGRKKILFPELSFVEQHMDTFYTGLNENVPAAAFNPLQARSSSKADQVVKNWVHPDSQLLKSRRRIPFTTPITNSTRESDRRIRPLEFLCGNQSPPKPVKSIKSDLFESQTAQLEYDLVAGPESSEQHHQVFRLRQLVDDLNQTDLSQCVNSNGNKTPVGGARILANDTPVEFYGVSIFERRRLGI